MGALFQGERTGFLPFIFTYKQLLAAPLPSSGAKE